MGPQDEPVVTQPPTPAADTVLEAASTRGVPRPAAVIVEDAEATFIEDEVP